MNKTNNIILKILLFLIVVAVLLFGGIYLWNKLYYNPHLDAPVYPGPAGN